MSNIPTHNTPRIIYNPPMTTTTHLDIDALDAHKHSRGKLEIKPKMPIETTQQLAMAYTPGVGYVAKHIADHPNEVNEYTSRGNMVAVISDGSAVLGLGNIGPMAALPVMEGKCLLFKQFANIDAIPIILSSQDPEDIIQAVLMIAPTFGGINLEDIAAPKCFYIEEQLQQLLKIPVIHDDQWGAAIATLAGIINALKVVHKHIDEARVVINGAGAAGTAIAKLLKARGFNHIIMCDSKGIVYQGRPSNNAEKELLATLTNTTVKGSFAEALKGADICIGVSKPGAIVREHIFSMATDPIIFALANPTPEIMPDQAKEAGARVVATGRSDLPNQINNALVFPGLFRGALDTRATAITVEQCIKAAEHIAHVIEEPTKDCIIPSVFDKKVRHAVASVFM